MNTQEYLDFEKIWADNSRDSILCHTSGSTGKPKEIYLKKSYMVDSADRTIRFFALSSASHLHSCISPEFIGGKMMFVRAWRLGCTLTSEKPSNRPLSSFSPKDYLDFVAVVPSQLLYICDNINSMPKIGCILVGGAPVNTALKDKIIRCGLNVYESYGMTETSSHVAVRKVDAEDDPFQLLPGISISLSADSCLEILMPGGTELKTHDIAEIVTPGKFIIKGRKDNVVISGGKKIIPEEIESALSSIIPFSFLVTGMDDEKWGQKLICVIAPENHNTFRDMEEFGNFEDFEKLVVKISEFASTVLEKYRCPKEYIFVRKLPLTDSGKVKRGVLTPLELESMGVFLRKLK